MKRVYLFLTIFTFLSISCTKEFLDKKPDKKLIIPTTLDEFQVLLEENDMFNRGQFWGEWGADNFYIEYNKWQSLLPYLRNAYSWEKNILEGAEDPMWREPYRQVFVANVCLDGIKKIEVNESNRPKYSQVKGMALYYRAEAFYNLVQVYAKPFISTTANQDLGIPLRLNSNLNELSVRATVKESYDQIIQDLQEAVQLVPEVVDMTYRNRPSRPTVLGMLSRIYLSMGDYTNALSFSDQSLQLYDTLLDYNQLNPTVPVRPFPLKNPEILTDAFLLPTTFFLPTVWVDTLLFNSYDDNDLRKALYFKTSQNKKYFTGQYTGGLNLFGGVATDEMYLVRAECNARAGNKDAAMYDLNSLLRTRWKKINGTTTYVDQTATDANDALIKILTERRKELCFRGLRWSDLRRLNQEPQFAKTLTRELNGETITLQPNDSRYVYPIPDNEIQLSGIQQNIR